MENNSIELSMMDAAEREQVEFIWNLIPECDRNGMTKTDILDVLDALDDYLEYKGLLIVDEDSGEAEYLDGDIDEIEQLIYIVKELQDRGSKLNSEQIQLILDGELQYGLANGYYAEED